MKNNIFSSIEANRRRVGLIKRFLLFFILFSGISADINVLYRKDVCDENEFYLPYVRLLRTRQPYHENFPIVKLFVPGYISLAKHTGVLCVNGPAIVFTDVNKDPKCGNEWIPSYGEPQIFSHDCFSINRLARDVYKRADEQQLTKETHVFGNKVFGIYLLGVSPDYRSPNFLFLPGPNFGYNPNKSWCVREGGSVVFLTNSTDTSTHCYNVKKYNMEGTVALSYSGIPSFCFREDRYEDFDMPWHKAGELQTPLTNEDISWDEPGTECNPLRDSVQKEMEAEPLQLPDFRMIHPKFWSSQGSQGIIYKAKRKLGDVDEIPVYSQPYPPGSLFPGEQGWDDPSSVAHVGPSASSMNDFATTSEPLQRFQAELAAADCEEVPKPPESCAQELGEPCVFINHVLTLEETDWKSDTLKDGSWRLQIIDLTNKIYERACPQVAKFLSSALSRVYQFFLTKTLEGNSTMKEKFNQPPKHEWSDMIMDLERCNEKAEMMSFFKIQNVPAIKYKAKLELKLNHLYESLYAKREAEKTVEESHAHAQLDTGMPVTLMNEKNDSNVEEIQEIEKIKMHLNEIPLRFPFKIFVGIAESPSDFSKANQVFQYREAAEIDHELDWALDSYWKVISAVLGYCNIHYSSRDSSTFMRLYDSFTQDFFDYISDSWTKGENRQIYDQLFGEFIYGPGTLWIDACQNGAYQWSQTTDLRPLRPLSLLEGDVPPGPITQESGKQPSPTNFFVDNPLYTKVTSDHVDFENEDASESASDGEIPEPFLSSYNRHNSVKTALRDSIVDPLHNFV